MAFSAGLVIAYFLYAFKVRFSITFLLLTALLYGIYRWLGGITVGEFERIYNKNNSNTALEQQTVEEYLDLFINFKLKGLLLLL